MALPIGNGSVEAVEEPPLVQEPLLQFHQRQLPLTMPVAKVDVLLWEAAEIQPLRLQDRGCPAAPMFFPAVLPSLPKLK